MKNILNFLIEIGKLRKVKRRGVGFYGEKQPESTADHTFRVAIAAWALAKGKNLNIEKVIKIALIHDLCELYAGDVVPYEGDLIKDKKKLKEFLKRWPYFPEKEKRTRHSKRVKREKRSLEKLTKNLPKNLKKEIRDLWLEFEKGTSKEGRFIREIDRLGNLLEAFECWERNKKFPINLWWQYAEQVITEPTILKLLDEIEKEIEREKKK